MGRVRAAQRLALLGVALALCGGCAGLGSEAAPERPFTALSTELVPLFGYQFEKAERVVDDVEVEVVAHTILWIPTRPTPPTLQETVEQVLVRGDGNVVVNAHVEHWWWYIPFLYGQEGWRVRGDVVRTSRED